MYIPRKTRHTLIIFIFRLEGGGSRPDALDPPTSAATLGGEGGGGNVLCPDSALDRTGIPLGPTIMLRASYKHGSNYRYYSIVDTIYPAHHLKYVHQAQPIHSAIVY